MYDCVLPSLWLMMKLKLNPFFYLILAFACYLLLFCKATHKNDCEITHSTCVGEPNTAKQDNDTIKRVAIREGVQLDTVLLKLLPASTKPRAEQILVRKSYIASYNKDWKIPNWVAWRLTAEHAEGNVSRRNSFREDPDVPSPRATPADYKGSDWSRGHMCPSGDNKWDSQANHETFLLSNICPQDRNLNSGLWNSIEMDCRKWAKRFGEVFVVCGPLPLRNGYQTIGENEVAVPNAFFKVVLCLKGTPKAFGFVVKNRSGEKKTDLYYNTVREVERLTNLDFFPLLPDSLEDAVETRADMDEWYVKR